jgi:16S rRNA (guanine527-N7)-methyltransferase
MNEKVVKFKHLLQQENQRINLISRQANNEDLDNHIEDCLKLLDYLPLKDKKVVDIGSGGGLPGMVLAAENNHNTYTLLEAERKKCEFLEKAAVALQMSHIKVIWGRAEDIGQSKEYRQSFDIGTSRAVASLRIIAEYSLPLIKEGGILILWKGPKYQEEIQEAQNALNILGGETADIHEYALSNGRQRALIFIRKIANTPSKYPRRSGVPLKRPL